MLKCSQFETFCIVYTAICTVLGYFVSLIAKFFSHGSHRYDFRYVIQNGHIRNPIVSLSKTLPKDDKNVLDETGLTSGAMKY